MHVNTEGLRSGAGRSFNAADHAYEGAGNLSRAAIASGIFGKFAEADTFHEAVSGAHRRHVSMIESHFEKLGIVGDKAHSAAADFADMEKLNETRLRAVRDQA